MTTIDQRSRLEIDVLLTKSDLFSATLSRSIRRPSFFILALAPGLSASFYFLTLKEPAGLLFIALLCVGFPLLIVYRTSTASAKQPGTFAPITYAFSDDGVNARFVNGKTEAAWSLVKGARETRDYFFIEMQRNSFHLIPKRLTSDEQVAHLRTTLRQHVAENIRIKG